VIIADESVSALDVSVQAQVLDLLQELQDEFGISYIFISHDMATVEEISHRVAVMFLGQIVETGSRRQVFENPQHPYTRRLLAAVPIADPRRHCDMADLIEGEVPSPIRSVGDEPDRIRLRQVEPGHLFAQGGLNDLLSWTRSTGNGRPCWSSLGPVVSEPRATPLLRTLTLRAGRLRP
jgi:glutathione transport system ATP-binding protein